MKKIFVSYIVCMMIFLFGTSVFAYASQSSTSLRKADTTDAVTAWIGYDYWAKATGRNDTSSKAVMTAAIWGSYKGWYWPNTKEKTVDVSWGKTFVMSDHQDITSIYRLVLTPRVKGYVSGSGTIRLGN